MYKIQIQEWFMWIDHMMIPPVDNNVAYYLNMAKQNYPDKRVRCVDDSGRLIDMVS
jgi:hypothetical protein